MGSQRACVFYLGILRGVASGLAFCLSGDTEQQSAYKSMAQFKTNQ